MSADFLSCRFKKTIFQELGRKRREKEEEVGCDFEPWSAKRGEILARFTTTEKLSIVRISACTAFRDESGVTVCSLFFLSLNRISSWALRKVSRAKRECLCESLSEGEPYRITTTAERRFLPL